MKKQKLPTILKLKSALVLFLFFAWSCNQTEVEPDLSAISKKWNDIETKSEVNTDSDLYVDYPNTFVPPLSPDGWEFGIQFGNGDSYLTHDVFIYEVKDETIENEPDVVYVTHPEDHNVFATSKYDDKGNWFMGVEGSNPRSFSPIGDEDKEYVIFMDFPNSTKANDPNYKNAIRITFMSHSYNETEYATYDSFTKMNYNGNGFLNYHWHLTGGEHEHILMTAIHFDAFEDWGQVTYPNLQVYIEGPSTLTRYATGSFFSDNSGGDGNYSYKWYSLDYPYSNWVLSSNTNPTFQKTMYANRFKVKVQVTSGDGQVKSSEMWVNYSSGGGKGGGGMDF